MEYLKILNLLSHQKDKLGLSEAQIARETSVSHTTVHRIFSGRHHRAAWNDMATLADFLGVSMILETENARDILERRAEKIARRVVQTTRATSELEGQGFSDQTQEDFIYQTKIELLAGPKRKLWDGL